MAKKSSVLSLIKEPNWRFVWIGLALLLAYQTLIWGGFISGNDGINQWESNVIKAERYIYNHNGKQGEILLVGSSMANRLQPEYLGDRTFNLAMQGANSLTGLEIALQAKTKPDLIMVEVNETIGLGVDRDLMATLYQPLLYYLRLYFPMFRQEYRPVSVLVSSLRSSSKQSQPQLNAEQQDKLQIKDERLRKKIIQGVVESRSKQLTPDMEANLRQQATLLKQQIQQIQQAGVKTLLFHIPGEPEVQNTVRQKQTRAILQEVFPADTFNWLAEPPRQNWVTSDGIHLIYSNAKEYAMFIKSQLMQEPLLLESPQRREVKL